MRLTSGAGRLALLCLALAAPARAARVNIGDQGGYVDVGAIIQTWARINENGAADHSNPSVDLFFRRMRIYVNAQYNEQIGVVVNTDVTYTAEPVATAFTGIVTNPVTSQNAIRFSSPGFVLNEALGYYRFCKELIFMAGLQLVPWVHETTEDVTKFGSLDEQTDVTERGRPGGFLTRNRDMGLAVRGLLFNEFLNYRIGVFNGVQSAAGATAATASGLSLTPGLTPAQGVTFPAYSGVNPGDAPSFDGYIRLNFIGSEPGYAFCGLCQDGKAYFSVGVGANIQPRAIAAPSRASFGASYEAYFTDLVLDLPFGDNEFVLEGGWVRNVYSGSGGPLLSSAALAAHQQRGQWVLRTRGRQVRVDLPVLRLRGLRLQFEPGQRAVHLPGLQQRPAGLGASGLPADVPRRPEAPGAEQLVRHHARHGFPEQAGGRDGPAWVDRSSSTETSGRVPSSSSSKSSAQLQWHQSS